jgi:hypothetical protein
MLSTVSILKFVGSMLHELHPSPFKQYSDKDNGMGRGHENQLQSGLALDAAICLCFPFVLWFEATKHCVHLNCEVYIV